MSKLTIVRGLPGSGKSTLAHKLAEADGNSVVLEVDQFFMIENDYKFTFDFLTVAHSWCLGQAFYHLFRGKNVIVANTFVEYWTVDKYIEAAFKAKIPWEVVEPKTKWKSDTVQLAEKNVHKVSQAVIQKMLDKWETTKEIITKLEAKGWAV